MHGKAHAASRCHAHDILELLALLSVDFLPLLLVAEHAHHSVSEGNLVIVNLVDRGHFVERHETSFFAQGNRVDFVHFHWDVHEGSALRQGLSNVIGHLEPVLIHGDDGFDLVGGCQADVTESKNVLVDSD